MNFITAIRTLIPCTHCQSKQDEIDALRKRNRTLAALLPEYPPKITESGWTPHQLEAYRRTKSNH